MLQFEKGGKGRNKKLGKKDIEWPTGAMKECTTESLQKNAKSSSTVVEKCARSFSGGDEDGSGERISNKRQRFVPQSSITGGHLRQGDHGNDTSHPYNGGKFDLHSKEENPNHCREYHVSGSIGKLSGTVLPLHSPPTDARSVTSCCEEPIDASQSKVKNAQQNNFSSLEVIDDVDDDILLSKPKLPRTAYNFFVQKERPKIVENMKSQKSLSSEESLVADDLSFSTIGKNLGEKWNNMDQESKAKYQKLARDDTGRYTHQLKEYFSRNLLQPVHEISVLTETESFGSESSECAKGSGASCNLKPLEALAVSPKGNNVKHNKEKNIFFGESIPTDFDDDIDDILFPKPKRPRTAYNFFVQKERSKIVENMKSQKSVSSSTSLLSDDVNFSSIGKNLGEKWKNLDQESKARYQKLAKEDTERYTHQLREYYSRKTLPPIYESRVLRESDSFKSESSELCLEVNVAGCNQEPLDAFASSSKGKNAEHIQEKNFFSREVMPTDFDDEIDVSLFPKPKRPRTAYNFFVQKERSKIVENMKAQKSLSSGESILNDNINFGSIGKNLGEKWNNLDCESKARYQKLAKEDIERYTHQLKSYYTRNLLHQSIESGEFPDGSVDICNQKPLGASASPSKVQNAEHVKGKNGYSMELIPADFEDDDILFSKPKRPRTAYNFFVQKERSKIVENMKSNKSLSTETSSVAGDINFSSIGKSLGKKWHNLDQESKARYNKLANEDTKRYTHEMRDYFSRKHFQPTNKSVDLSETDESYKSDSSVYPEGEQPQAVVSSAEFNQEPFGHNPSLRCSDQPQTPSNADFCPYIQPSGLLRSLPTIQILRSSNPCMSPKFMHGSSTPFSVPHQYQQSPPQQIKERPPLLLDYSQPVPVQQQQNPRQYHSSAGGYPSHINLSRTGDEWRSYNSLPHQAERHIPSERFPNINLIIESLPPNVLEQ